MKDNLKPTTLEGQVEYIIQQEQAKDSAQGLPPMSPQALEVLRGNVFANFKEGRAGSLTKEYGLPEIEVEPDYNSSNSVTGPDFSQPLAAPSAHLPPSTSFRDLITPYYGEATDQELTKAQGYVDSNFPATGTSGARQNIPDSFQSKLFSNANPDQVNRAIPIVRTNNNKGAVYDSTKDSIYAGRGPQNLSQPIGRATYRHGLTSVIDEAPDTAQVDAFKDTGALVSEIANAQRQHFKTTGARMEPDGFESMLGTGDYKQFEPPTQKALQYLNDQRAKGGSIYQDILKILPGLAQHTSPETAKQIFG